MCDRTGPCGTDNKIVRLSDKLSYVDDIDVALISAVATSDANIKILDFLIDSLDPQQREIFNVPFDGLKESFSEITVISKEQWDNQKEIWKIIDEPCNRSCDKPYEKPCDKPWFPPVFPEKPTCCCDR